MDVLHRLRGEPVDAGLLAPAEEHDVLGIRLPVLAPTAMVSVKLRPLTETAGNDFGVAFLVLTDRLGISSDANDPLRTGCTRAGSGPPR